MHRKLNDVKVLTILQNDRLKCYRLSKLSATDFNSSFLLKTLNREFRVSCLTTVRLFHDAAAL